MVSTIGFGGIPVNTPDIKPQNQVIADFRKPQSLTASQLAVQNLGKTTPGSTNLMQGTGVSNSTYGQALMGDYNQLLTAQQENQARQAEGKTTMQQAAGVAGQARTTANAAQATSDQRAAQSLAAGMQDVGQYRAAAQGAADTAQSEGLRGIQTTQKQNIGTAQTAAAQSLAAQQQATQQGITEVQAARDQSLRSVQDATLANVTGANQAAEAAKSLPGMMFGQAVMGLAMSEMRKQQGVNLFTNDTARTLQNQRGAVDASFQSQRQEIIDGAAQQGMDASSPMVQAQLRQLNFAHSERLGMLATDVSTRWNEARAQLVQNYDQMTTQLQNTYSQLMGQAGESSVQGQLQAEGMAQSARESGAAQEANLRTGAAGQVASISETGAEQGRSIRSEASAAVQGARSEGTQQANAMRLNYATMREGIQRNATQLADSMRQANEQWMQANAARAHEANLQADRLQFQGYQDLAAYVRGMDSDIAPFVGILNDYIGFRDYQNQMAQANTLNNAKVNALNRQGQAAQGLGQGRQAPAGQQVQGQVLPRGKAAAPAQVAPATGSRTSSGAAVPTQTGSYSSVNGQSTGGAENDNAGGNPMASYGSDFDGGMFSPFYLANQAIASMSVPGAAGGGSTATGAASSPTGVMPDLPDAYKNPTTASLAHFTVNSNAD